MGMEIKYGDPMNNDKDFWVGQLTNQILKWSRRLVTWTSKNKKVSLSSESEFVPCMLSLSWSSLTHVTPNQPLGLSAAQLQHTWKLTDKRPALLLFLVNFPVKNVKWSFLKVMFMSSVKLAVLRKIGTCLKHTHQSLIWWCWWNSREISLSGVCESV